MGYELTRFIDQIHEEYLCSVCSLVVKNPVESSPCGHIYCAPCIKAWLTLDETCPDDRQPLKPEDLKSPSRLIQSLLKKLRIRCDYYADGCQAIVNLYDLEGHESVCNYNPNAGMQNEIEKIIDIACSTDYQFLMSREEEDTLNFIDDFVLQQLEEMDVDASHEETSPWQVCHNIKESQEENDQTKTLECDGTSASGFIQSCSPLDATNSSFRIEIVIGLCQVSGNWLHQ